MKNIFTLLFICNLIVFKGSAQTIKITASNKPLNKILIELRDTYDANFSFNDTDLAKFKLSINKQFNDIEEALNYLLDPLPLSYDISDDVFVIYRKPKPVDIVNINIKKTVYSLSGQITDQIEREALPYTMLVINGNGIVTDESGNFSFKTDEDSVFSVRISHLGFFIKDTVVGPGLNKRFQLKPSYNKLEAIIITDKIIETFSQIGTEAGLIKLNHKVTNYLPGCNDNSIYNLLRLHPGILASGEQANDLIIWGSYHGQSKVMFDGFTIFGLKNFNDNISAVNPYIIQHMQIHKAGYDASYGDRVGGIVEINGKTGFRKKPSFDLSISNLTVNGLIQLPIGKQSSLQIAGRKTYYELYNADDIPILDRMADSTLTDIISDIEPVYNFMDINIKYSVKSKKGDLFYVSLLSGKDKFSYEIDRLFNNMLISKTISESNVQSGASLFYGKSWKTGLKTDFSLAYSSLNADFSNNILWQHIYLSNVNFQTDLTTINKTEEYAARFDITIPINANNSFETGLAFIKNASIIQEDSFETNVFDQSIKGEHMSVFFNDRMIVRKALFKFGARLNYLPYLKTFYFEPRASMSLNLSKEFKLNSAWGIYNQFISKSSVLDDLGNYRYIWTVADNIDIPVINAMHFVSGLSYHHNGFMINLEGYYKKTNHMSRYVNRIGRENDDVYTGDAKSVGIDVYLKQNIKGHTAWVSYTLSKSTELFEYYSEPEYRLAPHNQKHELKVAGLLNFDPFYFSANYVYGSGFPVIIGNTLYPIIETNPYKRVDVAFIYKFSHKKLFGEIGISILNLFNTENIKISNFERIPITQTSSIDIYTKSMPFTPSLYLKVDF